MKKSFVVALFAFVMVTSMFAFVSAQQTPAAIESLQNIGSTIVNDLLAPVFKIFVGDYNQEGQEPKEGDFLMRVLFLIIVFAAVFMAVDKISLFSSNALVHWVISGSVAILSVRFLGGQEIVQTILLPYTTLGIVFSAGFPFVLYFLIVNKVFDDSRLLRKTAWIFFAVVFVSLWIGRYEELVTRNNGNVALPFIYLITAGLALIMIFMDGTVQRWRHKMKIEKHDRMNEIRNKRDFLAERKKIKEDLKNGLIDQDEHDALIKDLKMKAKALGLEHLVPN